MDCRDFQKYLAERNRMNDALSPQLAEHIAACPQCRALLALVAQDETDAMRPSPTLIDAIATRIAADARPVKPIRSASYFALMFTVVFLAVTIIGAILFRPLGILLMKAEQASLIVTALALCAVATITSITRQIVPGRLHSFPPERWVALAAAGLVLLFFAIFPIQLAADFWKKCAICLGIGLGLAIPAGAALFALLRQGAAMNPRLAGSTAGLLAGLVGLTVLEIHCPLLEPLHIITSHVGALILTTLLGALAAPLLDRTRAATRSVM